MFNNTDVGMFVLFVITSTIIIGLLLLTGKTKSTEE